MRELMEWKLVEMMRVPWTWTRLGSACRLHQEGNTEAHRYYLARRTVLEMLKGGGYSVSLEIDMSLEEFVAIYGPSPDVDRLRLSASLQLDSSRRLAQFGSFFAQIVNKETLSSLILILRKDITSQARKALDLFSFKVKIFQLHPLDTMLRLHINYVYYLGHSLDLGSVWYVVYFLETKQSCKSTISSTKKFSAAM
ncbi:hypothetical protein K2173_012457 [Erythroxylum novogranatense]|uniref:RNA polymerase Rpb5 N-terminal domain-containing protein n=1 Tax=Erythroxylum novogranatense TaxID=1862640 RepID=A0AAV8SM42_9ROSI|nr:hypothetical protein K2173_012457 [Erythroxylum novogranatense]